MLTTVFVKDYKLPVNSVMLCNYSLTNMYVKLYLIHVIIAEKGRKEKNMTIKDLCRNMHCTLREQAQWRVYTLPGRDLIKGNKSKRRRRNGLKY